MGLERPGLLVQLRDGVVRHVVVVGAMFGDEGKGSVVDWLCSTGKYHTVVRFNGGGQAGHNVVLADGRHHEFAQFGAGTLRGARTFLSRFMLVDPLTLAAEATALEAAGVKDPLSMVTVDRRARLVTPYHVAANQWRELARGHGRHGSCGKGVGETTAYAREYPGDVPLVADCPAPAAMKAKLRMLADRLMRVLGAEALDGTPSPDELADVYRAFAQRVRTVPPVFAPALLDEHACVFEGAQGVLLDQEHGFAPHTTWTDCTTGGADRLLGSRPALRLAVTRTYMTRHGPGPFLTEDPTLDLPEPHNQAGPWQGPVRQGHLDFVMLRYALGRLPRLDGIALTHADATARTNLAACTAYDTGVHKLSNLRAKVAWQKWSEWDPVYQWLPASREGLRRLVEEHTGKPVLVVSDGPTSADKRKRKDGWDEAE